MMSQNPQKPGRVSLPLAGPTGGYLGQQLDPAKTVNMYSAQIAGQQDPALIMFPGTQTVFTNPSGVNARNCFQTGTFLFVVYGDQLVVYDTSLLTSIAYTINTSVGVANFAANNKQQVVLVDGVDGWVFDFSGVPTFTQITDAFFTSFNNPVDVGYLNGHFYVAFGSGNTFIQSGFENGGVYPALNFAQVTSAGNQLLRGLKVSSGRLYIFGTTVTEIWYPTGAASTFPIQRDDNSVIVFGAVNTQSITVGAIQVKSLYRIFPDMEDAVVWLAQWPQGTPKVLLSSMGSTSTISDPATEYKIQKLLTVSDAVGILVTLNAHTFYILTFPTANLSLFYDFDMKEWYELQMIDESYYFASCHAVFNNINYFGSLKSPTLSAVSDDYWANDTDAIHCQREMPIINLPSYERLSVPRFEVEMRSGTGLQTTQQLNSLEYNAFNLNPKIYLSHSVDGGYHFSQQREVTTGAVGQAQWKVMWQGMPVSARHVFRLDTFNATKTILLGAYAQIENMGY